MTGAEPQAVVHIAAWTIETSHDRRPDSRDSTKSQAESGALVCWLVG